MSCLELSFTFIYFFCVDILHPRPIFDIRYVSGCCVKGFVVVAADESLLQESIEETTMGIYVWKHRDASEKPEDIGIVLESQIVMQDMDNVPLAAAMLFRLIYSLNLNYPAELKYTFEVLQKVVMELEGNALSKKAQVLKNRLYQ
uniref:Uncharacterized protein n=1 Tax=Dicentrarchus labrax TaxID=13489 RepID=A0A8P4GE57_DICLA